MFWIYTIGTMGLMITMIIHAVRHGKTFPWLYVIVFLPLVGCIAYFIAEVLPDILRSPDAQKLKTAALDKADPERHLRGLRQQAEMSNSTHDKQALAEEYLRLGRADEGLAVYRDIMGGPFSDDPRLQLGFARALVEARAYAECQATLDNFQKENPGYKSPSGHLTYARALAGQGKADEAIAEFEDVVKYYSGPEARAHYALFLEQIGRRDDSRAHFTQIVKVMETSPAHVRKLHREWFQTAKTALQRLG